MPRGYALLLHPNAFGKTLCVAVDAIRMHSMHSKSIRKLDYSFLGTDHCPILGARITLNALHATKINLRVRLQHLMISSSLQTRETEAL